MTESDNTQHWRELAEQLGLPPESADTPAVAPRPEPRSVIRAHEELLAPAEPLNGGEAAETAREQAREMPSEPAPEGERPSRGRRRGRRGSRGAESRSADNASTEAADDEPPGVEVPADPENAADTASPRERSPGRGRGRSRHKRPAAEAPRVLEPVDNDEDETEPAPELGTDADDADEEDDLSGWNIPSWQELIDSLHRPER
jgi:hypothetical protein